MGLECSLFGVQRSDLLVGSRRLSHVVVTKFLVSRGCNVISMFAFRCPEVGFEGSRNRENLAKKTSFIFWPNFVRDVMSKNVSSSTAA